MPDLGAVLDAPVDEVVVDAAVDTTADTQVDAAVVVDDKPAEEVKGDERLISQKWRDLKATNPDLYKEYKGLFFGQKTLGEKLKDFDLDGTKGWLEENGGREAIVASLGELQGKAAELDTIAGKMANGDESLITDLAESSPEGFVKLAKAAAGEYQRVDPEGWAADMSGIMAATIQQNGIPMFLEKMGLYLEVGKTDQIAPMLQQLKDWAGSFTAKAAAPRTNQPAAQPNKLDAREQALNQRETQAFKTDMEREVDTFRTPLISKELDSFFKRRPNDADAKELAIATVAGKVVAQLSGDKKYQDALNALWSKRDKDGALKLIKSRESAAIVSIAPTVGRTIFGNPGAAAAAVTKPVGTPSKAEAGYSFTDKPPKPELIDRVKTTDAMIMRGKFIMKDGSKLTLEA